MGSPSLAPSPPTRAAARATWLLGLGLASVAAGCNFITLRGRAPGPTIGGSDPTGTSGPSRIAETCRVRVSNETGSYLDVTWIARSSDGASRSGNLGRIDPGDSRSTTVRCGDSVTAYGHGGGRNVQSSIVAQRTDDSWIHLTEIDRTTARALPFPGTQTPAACAPAPCPATRTARLRAAVRLNHN